MIANHASNKGNMVHHYLANLDDLINKVKIL